MEEVLETTDSTLLEAALSSPGALAQWWEEASPQVIAFLMQVLLAAVTLFIGVKLIKMLVRWIGKVFDKGNLDKGVCTFLLSLIKYGLYFVLVMVILSGFGVAASSTVAILGSAGLTIGLGFQGSLANIAGGVLILLLKPFAVDDYISNGSEEGVVVEITLFYTHLLTVDNKRVVIPNGSLSNNTIVNYSRMHTRRLDLKIGVTYESDLRQAKSLVEQVVRDYAHTLQEEGVQVLVTALEDSSVTVEARIWVANENYWTAKFDLLEAIKLAIDASPAVNMAYPHMTVDMMN